MFTSVVLLLLASLSPAVLASVDQATQPVIGRCFIYQVAFPDGPENADLSQSLCQLLHATKQNLPCDGDGALDEVTGEDFMENYSAAQDQFCTENAELIASVLEGTHAESMSIFETALAEELYMLGHGRQEEEESRRKLFFKDLFERNPEGGMWATIGVATAIMVVVIVFFVFAGRRNRRALAGMSDVVLVTPTDVLEECDQGSIHSFICDLPMNEFVHIFTTGLCAGAVGLSCVVSREDFLAIANGSN